MAEQVVVDEFFGSLTDYVQRAIAAAVAPYEEKLAAIEAQLATVRMTVPHTDSVALKVREEVATAVVPLKDRLATLEAHVPHADSIALKVRDEVATAVDKAVAALPKPRDGRDALDLEIVEELYLERTYPAGTFALHGGGTALAVRDTAPLNSVDGDLERAGWKVMQEGIATITAKPIDDLTHRVIITRTSGKTEHFDFVTSFANIDKGVYRPGMRYRAGFGVTKDLGFWIARRDTTETPPHDDWRLAIKGHFRGSRP